MQPIYKEIAPDVERALGEEKTAPPYMSVGTF